MEPEDHVVEGGMSPGRSDRGSPALTAEQFHDVSGVFAGEHGLRAGWSVALFVGLYYLLLAVVDEIVLSVYPRLAEGPLSPMHVLLGEALPFVVIFSTMLFMARVEHRSLWEYNLASAHWLRRFAAGFATGFVALSALVMAMALGGWLQFDRTTLNGAQALKYGSIWAAAFLLVGFCEEGIFRCYLQATLTRGINFWWALAAVAGICLLLMTKPAAQGASGVYTMAALGVIPCWLLKRKGDARAGFWQAAWATSTAFGYFHTGNNGETWVGVFAASLIGFVFCVSVWLTGSAWWAIGCHMAWDWTETFFYGTADSGIVSRGHLLTTRPHGDGLWSGGSDGPEGSLLILPAVLLLLGILLTLYRRRPAALAETEPLAD